MGRYDDRQQPGLKQSQLRRRRTAYPGRFVAIVGPDGVGKTAVATELLAQWPKETRYFHFRPPIASDLDTEPPTNPPSPPPKKTNAGSPIVGWLRIARSAVLFWVGYNTKVRPAVRRGALVVADRWAYSYLLQPTALRFAGPDWLARFVIRALPQPDLVVNLSAPAEVIRSRKSELSLQQIQRELRQSRDLPVERLITLNAKSSPTAIAKLVVEQLESGA